MRVSPQDSQPIPVSELPHVSYGNNPSMTEMAINSTELLLKVRYKARAEDPAKPKASPSPERISALAKYLHDRSLRNSPKGFPHLG